MKREDVKAIFPNASEEEIDSILNKIGEEINPLKKQLEESNGERSKAQEALEAAKVSEAGLKAELEKTKEQLQEGMSAEERIAAREKAAEEREAEFNLRKNQLEAQAIFVGAGCFDTDGIEELVKQVSNADGDVTKANAQRIVDTVTKQREAVEKETKDALLKANPKLGDPAGNGGSISMKKSEFLKMPYKDQLAMKESNPDILSQLQEG